MTTLHRTTDRTIPHDTDPDWLDLTGLRLDDAQRIADQIVGLCRRLYSTALFDELQDLREREGLPAWRRAVDAVLEEHGLHGVAQLERRPRPISTVTVPSWAVETSEDDCAWSYWRSTVVEVAGARLFLSAAAGPSGEEPPALQLEASSDRMLTADEVRSLAHALLDHADRLDRG